MGRLEKLGVLIIVVLLGVIIAVGFLKDSDPADAPGVGRSPRRPEDAVRPTGGRGAGSVARKEPVRQPKPADPPALKREAPDDERPAAPGGTGTTRKPDPADSRAPAGGNPGDPGTARPEPDAPKPGPAIPAPVDAPVDPKTQNGSSPKSITKHRIRAGDTYTKLAKLYYGTADKAALIQAANPGVAPEKLKLGMEITVPAAVTTPGSGTRQNPDPALETDPSGRPAWIRAVQGEEPSTPPAGATAPAGGRSVTVKRNDSLRGIAKRVYGDEKHWKLIFDANRSSLPTERSLRPGMVLVLPELPAR